MCCTSMSNLHIISGYKKLLFQLAEEERHMGWAAVAAGLRLLSPSRRLPPKCTLTAARCPGRDVR